MTSATSQRKMRAVRWHAANDLRLDLVPVPELTSNREAIVRVSYAGICGTDLHEFSEGPTMIRETAHPLTGASPPMTLGHELSGVVVSTSGGSGYRTGDRVAVDPCWSCDRCFWCTKGDYHICKLGGSVGLASDGGFAPFVRVPANRLALIPPEVSDQAAALAEPLAVGLHAVKKANIRPGVSALILGAGAIGIAVYLAARASGASHLYVSDPSPGRRRFAASLEANVVYDPTTTDVRQALYYETGKVGPDVVFECTGVGRMLTEAIECVRRGGRVVSVGVGHGTTTVTPSRITLLEKEIIGSLGYNNEIPEILQLMATGQIHTDDMISRVLPLESVPQYFQQAVLNPTNDIKVLVDLTKEHA